MAVGNTNGLEELASKAVKKLADKYNFTYDEVRGMLKEKFKSFVPTKIHEYDVYIHQMDLARQDEIEEKEIEDKIKSENIPLPPCPICGADTFGDPSLFGKITKTPGWQCSKGGVSHYYRWRTNIITQRKGLGKIFPEIGDKDE